MRAYNLLPIEDLTVTDLELPLFDAWAFRRTHLKHNWFDHLADLLHTGDGQVPGLLLEWPEKAPLLRQWVSEAEGALSPRQVLQLPAFAHWHESSRADWAEQLHQRFLARSGVRSLCDEIQGLLDDLDREVRPHLDRPGARLNRAERERLATASQEICRRLSELPAAVAWPGPPRTGGHQTAALPTILVIDDLLGRPGLLAGAKNPTEPVKAALRKSSELRRAFCEKFLLHDTNSTPAAPVACIAEVSFCAGQTWSPEDGFRNSLPAIQKAVGSGERQCAWDLVLLDVNFNTGPLDARGDGRSNDQFGIDRVLPWLRERHPQLPVVVVTNNSREEIIRRVNEMGLAYLNRREADARALLRQLFEAGRATPAQLRRALGITNLVAEDHRTLEVFLQAYEAAYDPQEPTVLILGESGSGKEEIAQYLHHHSRRRDRPLVTTNCATLSQERAQSELFGYYKKAFTGAREEDTEGLFHRAHSGTLFLDEVGDLVEVVQTKLLRTLNAASPEKRDIEPVGNSWKASRLPTQVNVRVICATDQSKERLRAAFFRRISATKILLPPLRDRPDDIVPLAFHFFRTRLGVPGMALTDEGQRYLRSLPYRGNAGELEAILRETIKGKGGRNLLDRKDLERAYNYLFPEREQEPGTQAAPSPAPQAGVAKAADLPSAIQAVLQAAMSPTGFGGLTQIERMQIDDHLRGRLMEVVAALLEWALFSSRNAADLARYLTERRFRSPREPQDVVKRFLALHNEVLERIQRSPHVDKHAIVKKLLDDLQTDGRKKNRLQAP